MRTFLCIYQDVKQTQHRQIEAPDKNIAFEQFIRHRKTECWTLSEIYTRSKLIVVNQCTGQAMVIEPYGELSQPGTSMLR